MNVETKLKPGRMKEIMEGTGKARVNVVAVKEEIESDLQVLGVRRWRELVVDRKKMEGHCSTCQSPQWAVVPMEE